MDKREAARAMDGKLYRVFRCCGQEFPVYFEYSDADGNAIPNYPNFEDKPLFTGDGRPFLLSVQEGCGHAEPDTPGEVFDGECGGCKYFYREPKAAFSVFGICLCEARRQPGGKDEKG